jgi:hypothetical protein
MACDRRPTLKRHPAFRPVPAFRTCRPVLLSTLLLAELSLTDRPLLASRGSAAALVEAAHEVLAVRASRAVQGVVEGGVP